MIHVKLCTKTLQRRTENILEAKELLYAFGGCSPRGNHVGDSNENVAKQKIYLAEQ